MQRLIVIAFSLLLAGCYQTKPIDEMNYAETTRLANEIKARCAAQGAGPGTAQWDTCAKIEMNSEIVSRNKAEAERKQWDDDRRRRADIAAAAAASQPYVINTGVSQGTYLNTPANSPGLLGNMR